MKRAVDAGDSSGLETNTTEPQERRFMRTIRRLSIAILAAGVLAAIGGRGLLAVGGAPPPPFFAGPVCDAVPDDPLHCDISNVQNLGAGGAFAISKTLHIKSTGGLVVNPSPGSLNLTITGVDGAGMGLIMADGAKITGDAPLASGTGATITLTVTGNVLLAGDTNNGGALISSNQNQSSCSSSSAKGGDIHLTSANGSITIEAGARVTSISKCPAGAITIDAPKGAIDIDGLVLSKSFMTGVGNAQNVAKGGGPITIKASCNLIITPDGIVSSEGLDPGADLVHLEACSVVVKGLVQSTGHGHAVPRTNFVLSNLCNSNNHPGKPDNATGCVEIWADTIEINGPAGGEVHADIGGPGGTQGVGWVDLYARKNINIIGVADLNTAAGCNQHVQDNGFGINQGCKVGVDATGAPLDHYAVHANGGTAQNTDDGGFIVIVSKEGSVSTSNQAVQAASTSAGGTGGDVSIEAALNINFGTASIQAKGNSSNGVGGHIGRLIPLKPVRSYATMISGSISGELNAAGGPAVGTVVLQACTADPTASYTGTVVPALTSLGTLCGATEPTLPAYVSLPLANCSATCDFSRPDDGFCEKGPVKAILNPITGRFPGNKGPDVTVRLDLIGTAGNPTSIQDALNTVSDSNAGGPDGYIILAVVKDDTGQLGGSRTESIVINRAYGRRFALIGCSVTLKDADTADGQPTALIASAASSPAGSPENIFVMDLHGSGSDAAGWKVEYGGDRRYLRNVATNNNALAGVWIGSNYNTMHNGNGNDNAGDGIYVNGGGNIVDSSDVFGNGGHGVEVVGGSNKILKVDAGDKGKGNGGDGVNVSGGTLNTVQEVDAYSNGGYGIRVAGNNNTLLKNSAGDKGKANTLDGMLLAGNNNTVQENDAYANGGNGINVSGTGNTLKKNTSGDRGDKANGLAGFLLSGGSSLTENEAIGNLGDGFHLLTGGFTVFSKNVSGGSGSGYPNGGCQYRFDTAGNTVSTGSNGNKSNNVVITPPVAPFPVCK
jgi:hypothetical protein